MDYYASWPSWKMPKWVGATLGCIFSLIVVLCGAMIVHLTRPPRMLAAPAAVVAIAKPIAPAQRAKDSAAVAPAKEASVLATQQPTPATKKTHDAPRTRRRAILAKHDGKPGRQAKSDIDRLLGL